MRAWLKGAGRCCVWGMSAECRLGRRRRTRGLLTTHGCEGCVVCCCCWRRDAMPSLCVCSAHSEAGRWTQCGWRLVGMGRHPLRLQGSWAARRLICGMTHLGRSGCRRLWAALMAGKRHSKKTSYSTLDTTGICFSGRWAGSVVVCARVCVLEPA